MSPLLPHGNGYERLGPGASRAAGRALAITLGAMVFAVVATLLRLTLVPSEDSAWLLLAMLASLPWSLLLLLLDPSAGLAERGAWVVAIGLTLNLGLLAWGVASVRRRVRRHRARISG